MKERPILFSAPMVRAILAGTKTQTRRLVNQEAPDDADGCCWIDIEGVHQFAWVIGEDQDIHPSAAQFRCPYGQPGDRLWVRETHAPQADCWGAWERWSRGDGGVGPIIHYKASDEQAWVDRWRPSIHMPRWASRITLEVTAVRVERLKDISAADCLAEGIDLHPSHHEKPRDSLYGPVQTYRDLWESINGPGSWYANPWVWVVEFKKLEQQHTGVESK